MPYKLIPFSSVKERAEKRPPLESSLRLGGTDARMPTFKGHMERTNEHAWVVMYRKSGFPIHDRVFMYRW